MCTSGKPSYYDSHKGYKRCDGCIGTLYCEQWMLGTPPEIYPLPAPGSRLGHPSYKSPKGGSENLDELL